MADNVAIATNGFAPADSTPHLNVANNDAIGAPKRKRVGSEAEEKINGNVDATAASNESPLESVREQVIDLLTILKKYDLTPSLFDQPLGAREDTKEPHTKRARVEDDTVAARVAANAYRDLDSMVSDIKLAAKHAKEDRQLPSRNGRDRTELCTPSESTLLAHINLLVKKAEELAQRQKTCDDVTAGKQLNDVRDGKTHDVKTIKREIGGPVALTIYGQRGQLFSSFQSGVNGDKVVLPVREAALPNGFGTTEIVQSSAIAEDKKKSQTLGDLFTKGTSLPFVPQKPFRSSSGKGLANGWSQPSVSDTTRSRNNQSYFSQHVSSGQWLEYRGATKENDLKRKQRDRALSLSGVKATLSAAEAEEQEARDLDALFRSAYSSFAPTRDDSAAIVPERVINRIWWQRVGEKSFERLAENVDQLDLDSKTEDGASKAKTDELAEFESVVENWDAVVDPSLATSGPSAREEKSAEERDADEILESISELLETLNSYQRNRNLSVPTVSRPSAACLVGVGSVSEPDQHEIDTYNILKSQLSLMISTLPPYAVAKLNSDQLAELTISTKIPITVEPQNGNMDEESYVRDAKLQSVPATTAPRAAATPIHHRSNSSTLYGNQYNTAPRQPTSGAAQYFNATPARNTQPLRPPQTVGALPYNTGAPRAMPNQQPQYRGPGYGTPTVPHTAPRPAPQQYPQNAAAYYNTPSTGRYTTAGMPGNVPQPMRYQPGTANQGYQQRPLQQQTNGGSYSPFPGNSTPNIPRQASPQKPFQPAPSHNQYGGGQSQNMPMQRGFGTPTPAAQNYYGGSMGMSAGLPMAQSMQQQIASGGTAMQNMASMGGNMNGGSGMVNLSNANSNMSSVAANSNASGMTSGGMGSGMGMGGGLGGGGGMGSVASSLGSLGYHTTMTPAEQQAVQERARLAAQQQQQRMTPNGMSPSPGLPRQVTPGQGAPRQVTPGGQGGMNGN